MLRRESQTTMDNVEEILQALSIAIAVASFLLQTCRYRKAIDLFTECLMLARNIGHKEKEASVLHMLGDWAFSRFDYSEA